MGQVTLLRVGIVPGELSDTPQFFDLCRFVADTTSFEGPQFYRDPTASKGMASATLLTDLIETVERAFAQQSLPKVSSGEAKAADVDLTPLLDLQTQGADPQCDLLLWSASGPPPEEILSCASMGVLSLTFGKSGMATGRAIGLPEVIAREPGSWFAVLLHTKDAPSGKMLRAGSVMTSGLWLSNRMVLVEKAHALLRIVLADIAAHGLPSPSAAANDWTLGRSDAAVGAVAQAGYAFQKFSGTLSHRVSRVFKGDERTKWNVAVASFEGDINDLRRHTVIANPKRRFFADPFVVKQDGRTVCFVEDYCLDARRGRISAIEIGPNGTEELGPVLQEPYHISFPYSFHHDGTLYMVPETHDAREIRLYRCVEFPLRWKLETVLMSNVVAADTMLFENAGTWFLLSNICSAGIGDHNSELHVFHAPMLTSTEWMPVETGNPVIFDSGRARNAGAFRLNGDLIRVAQKHGDGHYGKSVTLNTVTELSPSGYSETHRLDVPTDLRPDIRSMHHLHIESGTAVFDFQRR